MEGDEQNFSRIVEGWGLPKFGWCGSTALRVESGLVRGEREEKMKVENNKESFRCFSVEEIASMLFLSPITVQRMCRSGKLDASKVGKRWLVQLADVQAFVDGLKPKAKNSRPTVVG